MKVVRKPLQVTLHFGSFVCPGIYSTSNAAIKLCNTTNKPLKLSLFHKSQVQTDSN